MKTIRLAALAILIHFAVAAAGAQYVQRTQTADEISAVSYHVASSYFGAGQAGASSQAGNTSQPQGAVCTQSVVNGVVNPISGNSSYIGRYFFDTWNLTNAKYATGYSPFWVRLLLNGQGKNLGNNGTSAEGWFGDEGGFNVDIQNFVRGNAAAITPNMNSTGTGDRQGLNTSLYAYGGTVDASYEGVEAIYANVIQKNYTAGTITGDTAPGTNLITAKITNDGIPTAAGGGSGGGVFNDGAILIDVTQGGTATTTLTAGPTFDKTARSQFYTISTKPATSTAYGSIQASTCKGNGTGDFQQVVSTTCQIALQAGSGHFTTASHMYLSGPSYEEVAVTSASMVNATTDQVTFNTRYAWNTPNNASVAAQGGIGGMAFTATGTAVPAAVTAWSIASNVLTLTVPNGFQVGQTVILGGFNGPTSTTFNYSSKTHPIFTVTKASDSSVSLASPKFTNADDAATESGTALNDWPIAYPVVGYWNSKLYFADCYGGQCNGVETSAPLPHGVSITFYPAAEIVGTNNQTKELGAGSTAQAQLGVNAVRFAAGDTVVSTPTSQFRGAGSRVMVQQNTPTTNNIGNPGSSGYLAFDGGSQPVGASFIATNFHNAYNASTALLWSTGAYQYDLFAYDRPTQGVISINTANVFGSSGPYFWIQDSGNKLMFTPATGWLSYNNTFVPNTLQSGTIRDTGVVNATALKTDSSGNIGAAAVAGSGPNLQTALLNGTPTYTPGTGVASVACAPGYACTNGSGELTISNSGGSATTGRIATVNFSGRISNNPGLCTVSQNGGAANYVLGHGVANASGFTITAGSSIAGANVVVDYRCTP